MPDDGRLYDGHVNIFGMDGTTDPSALSPSIVTKAVNRIFRGGRNRTRPPFRHFPFAFDDPADAEVVKFGNIQGWIRYEKRREGTENGIVVAIAGVIFFLVIVNETIMVRRVFTGNNPKLQHTWFVQAEDWVYIQNGIDLPIFWNGAFPSTARRSNPAELEMPIGTIMAYAHGRVWLSNAFDQIIASDIIYGDKLTTTAATQKFTENEYWAEGGYFSQPTMLGPITGMVVIPRLNQNSTGQGELIVLSRYGASSFEPSIPRKQWQDSKIQTVTLTGRGNIAHGSVITVNNDVWFRSDDGISSYQASMSEQTRQPVFGKLSREVNNWLNSDTKWLLPHAKMLYFGNRVYCTTYPELVPSKDNKYGSHVYHNGMIVLDLDPASGVSGDAGFNWDGLWTGIRPTALINFGMTAFAFSHDSDGCNRIYSLDEQGQDDVFEDAHKKIEWFYVTKRFAWEQGKSNRFEIKKLLGGEMWLSGIVERSNLEVKYRHDYSIAWNKFLDSIEFGSFFGDAYKFTYPLYLKVKLGTPEAFCDTISPYQTHKGSQFQFKVSGKGSYFVESFRAGVGINEPSGAVPSCDDTPETLSLTGEVDNDFYYSVVI